MEEKVQVVSFVLYVEFLAVWRPIEPVKSSHLSSKQQQKKSNRKRVNCERKDGTQQH